MFKWKKPIYTYGMIQFKEKKKKGYWMIQLHIKILKAQPLI